MSLLVLGACFGACVCSSVHICVVGEIKSKFEGNEKRTLGMRGMIKKWKRRKLSSNT